MIARFHALQQLVLASRAEAQARDSDPFLARLEDALCGLREPNSLAGGTDLAALLRQGMWRCHLAHGEIPELRVPRGEPWPDEKTWSLFSCEVRRTGSDHFLVRAGPWTPAWLDAGAPSAVNDAIEEKPRPRLRPVLADPRVTEFTGYDEYLSRGQLEAVRAAFLMPPGSAVVVNLPTGAGKTLAFQLPALVSAAEDGGLTVVVVPTVALARDQEERFRKLLARHERGAMWSGSPLAYHSGLNEEAKNAIRTGIRNGSVPIVFVSPEVAVGALRDPLFEAARQGRLRILAIDEAHIVSQWGQNFRPEFQSIAGLRDALLDVCPGGSAFRTLLLSATLTVESFDTLRELFGRDNCQLVSELALRSEPAFLLNSASDEAQREERVLEAIRHLPRPLIVYTTLRDHAEKWYDLLRKGGFRRLRLVRGGDLGDEGGEAILRDWRDRALDIVVATSAFGLGVDQSEVRSIVHACLPENIDRYYQEVGRAGRDGNAAVALLVSTPRDLKIAKTMAKEKLISVHRAFERWESMWLGKRPGPNGSYLLSLNDRPPDLPDQGIRNASWNLRTLVLMARAGLIAFAAHAPPKMERRQGEDEATFESRRQEDIASFAREVAVRVKDPLHLDRSHWDDVVARKRRELRAADEVSSRLVGELRDLRRPLSEIFSDVYALPDPPVRVPRSIGSCPETRRRGTAQFASEEPDVHTIAQTAAVLSPEFERAVQHCSDGAARSWVAYDMDMSDRKQARRLRERARSLLHHAVSHGIVELSVSETFLHGEDWAQLAGRSPLRFLLRTHFVENTDAPFSHEVPVPRLTMVAEPDATAAVIERIMRAPRPRHVIVLPRGVLDPERPERMLFDVKRHIDLDVLLLRLET
jgi:superfamily II DNA helicase RecQ